MQGTEQQGGPGGQSRKILVEDAGPRVPRQHVEHPGPLDLPALQLGHVERDVRPVGLREIEVAGRLEDCRRVEVEHHAPTAAA